MKTINILLLALAATFAAFGFILREESQTITADGAKTGIEIGNKAPELVFNNPAGKPIPLSSLKGKVVLIDFWASWCGPCRMENPNLVRAYHKYKEAKFENAKGFTIYSVSLDRDQQSWINAIQKDKLVWEYHVSDLKAWASQAAQIYRVNSIPSSFIIDANGIIIAKNLRGPMLETELDKLLKKSKEKKDAKKEEAELFMTK